MDYYFQHSPPQQTFSSHLSFFLLWLTHPNITNQGSFSSPIRHIFRDNIALLTISFDYTSVHPLHHSALTLQNSFPTLLPSRTITILFIFYFFLWKRLNPNNLHAELTDSGTSTDKSLLLPSCIKRILFSLFFYFFPLSFPLKGRNIIKSFQPT